MYESPELDLGLEPGEGGDSLALAEKLAHLLADVVAASHIAQGYHWNVTGPDFKEMHAFFAEIYGDLDGTVDPLAENILKLGFDAPYFLGDFDDLTCVKNIERIENGYATAMVQSLHEINEVLLRCTQGAFNLANSINEQGIANFLAERIDAHQKWAWQLKATLGIK